MFENFYHGLQTVGKAICRIIWWFVLGLYTVITIFPKYFIIGLIFLFNKKKRGDIKKKAGNPKLPMIMMGLSFVIYLIMVFIFSRWAVQNLKIRYLQEDILNSTVKIQEMEKNLNSESSNGEDGTLIDQEEKNGEIIVDKENVDASYLDVSFDDLIKKNSETVAWIKVNGTKVNYPVVQHNDNEYYLHHDFYGNATDMGWVYGDYRDNFSTFGYNTVIYGHNLINKTMFGSVPSLLKKSWYNNPDNHYIKISTPTSNTVWKVFSVYEIEPVVDYLMTYFTEEEYKEWLKMIKGRSVHKFDVELSPTDKVITLSTCNDAGTKRVAVHGKLIKVQYKK